MTPTRLIFGENVIVKLPEVMGAIGKRVLLTYGGGSIKKIGLYDRVKELLKDFEIVELPGFSLIRSMIPACSTVCVSVRSTISM